MKNYKVTLANNEVMHVHKSWFDFWFLESGQRLFRLQDGKKIWFYPHWIIKIEQE